MTVVRARPHDEDDAAGGRCWAGCCKPGIAHEHPLSCALGGTRNHTHEAMFEGSLARALSRFISTVQISPGAGSHLSRGLRNGPSCENTGFQSHGPMLGVTTANPGGPGILDASVDIPASVLAKTTSQKHQRHRGGCFFDTPKLIAPLAFSVCVAHSRRDAHRSQGIREGPGRGTPRDVRSWTRC